ncbi:RNA-directed DNA polymerase [Candidatus Magnetomoraceae bacterium gMMP-15]
MSSRSVGCWVLKAVSFVLNDFLNPVISNRCFHIAGNGGAKAAVREVQVNLESDSFVMKSDVRGYYASIDHHILYGLLEKYVPDTYVLRLLWQYMQRTVCYGGLYREVKQGISLGCPLSPLMGALYLKPLDDIMAGTDVFYARFMDDWIIIAPTRWKLRKAIRKVNETLNMLKVEQHPDKTMIGRGKIGRFQPFSKYLHVGLIPPCPLLPSGASYSCFAGSYKSNRFNFGRPAFIF